MHNPDEIRVEGDSIPRIAEGTPDPGDEMPAHVHIGQGEGKFKRRVTFFGLNRETKVEEMRLLSVVSGLVGVSIDDFIRGAALQAAARIVLAEKQRQLKAHEQTDAVAATSVDKSTSEQQESNNQEPTDGVLQQEASKLEAPAAEAGAAADGSTHE